MLKIFNTLTRKKEIFKPIRNKKIKMYVCGVTVYELCHIGHGRTFIVFDMISRYLRFIGYQLKYVRSITDIDDKIINQAKKNNENYLLLANRMIDEMNKDFNSINILRPNDEPRVTFHINEIINMIEILIKRGNAYISSNGDVMFSVSTDLSYGRFSSCLNSSDLPTKFLQNKKTKRNPIDFVLWKKSSSKKKESEPNWFSPWGKGRPGWHIQCSAMNYKQFGIYTDIHGGGSDLIFPHHENEIAQSTCAYDFKHVKYWIHSGMVLKNKKKISKLNNNSLTIREILKNYDGETLRYFLMSNHYRSQLNYSEKNLKKSRLALERLYGSIRGVPTFFSMSTTKENLIISETFKSKFIKAMNNDFNVPNAYSVLFDMVRKINKLKKEKDIDSANFFSVCLRKLASILGLLEQDPDIFLKRKNQTCNTEIKEIEKLINIRIKARKEKNWILADKIRDQLKKMNVFLEDNFDETTWKKRK